MGVSKVFKIIRSLLYVHLFPAFQQTRLKKKSTCKIFIMEILPGKKKVLPEDEWKDRICKNDEYTIVMSRNNALKTITQAKFSCTTHVLHITLHSLLVS